MTALYWRVLALSFYRLQLYHCYRRNEGILDRQYVTEGVVFRKDMTYQRVLEKCVSVVFPDDAHDDCKYYVSNGRGMHIYVDEYIRVDNEEGEEELIPWTLETYIKLLSIKQQRVAHQVSNDVYAIGAVLLVMFGETQVWPELTPFQIMYRVTVHKEKPETAHLPLYMQKFCQSCFEEISLRPPSNVMLQCLLIIKHDLMLLCHLLSPSRHLFIIDFCHSNQ